MRAAFSKQNKPSIHILLIIQESKSIIVSTVQYLHCNLLQQPPAPGVHKQQIRYRCACIQTHMRTYSLGYSPPKPRESLTHKGKLPVAQLLVASCSFALVRTIPPSAVFGSVQRRRRLFICALWICFPQIIYRGPLGLSRDSRQTRCACLIKESDVYKCKHSILFTRCARSLASRCLLSGARWLGALLSLLPVKSSAKPNSIGVERHFISDAWTRA